MKTKYEFKKKKAILYPNEYFDELECVMTGELATIIAESNSWKTTFALDMIARNSEKWIKWVYINLEFPIETMWQSRRLWYNGKTKKDLTEDGTLTDEEIKDLEDYVNRSLDKFECYNEPNGIDLDKLIQYIEIQAVAGVQLFVIDTFSRIHGNLEKDARSSQNRCMEELQETAQRLNVAIILLHHTNKQGDWEGSQKIMDLSNVFMVITKDEDWDWEECRWYELRKDKYMTNKKIKLYYRNWKYANE